MADILVFDHHKSEGAPPPIRALVNPNRLDCSSGLTHLCAAAVTFIAGVALLRTLRQRGFFATRAEPDMRDYLDLVAAIDGVCAGAGAISSGPLQVPWSKV